MGDTGLSADIFFLFQYDGKFTYWMMLPYSIMNCFCDGGGGAAHLTSGNGYKCVCLSHVVAGRALSW